ncbi:MAG: hypothetical protein H6733_05035 [Alphaproteobacteria bacterium]|nr:hypothetical protein [Alphaproteobacteria bacterium]
MLLLPLLLGLATTAHAADTVATAFPPPAGFTRLPADAYATWLQAQPVEAPDRRVRTWDGRVVGHRGRVIRLPLVAGDLQQCADTLIRWRATWLRAQGQPVAFHATSGDVLPWARVTAGEVPTVDPTGHHILWVPGTLGWEGYLAKVFTWAGTASLARSDTRPTDAVVPGALLVDPGAPGHAVQIVDVATRENSTVVLLAEGYMPAMDAHVELGPIDGWWRWDDGVALGHWSFDAGDVRLWR